MTTEALTAIKEALAAPSAWRWSFDPSQTTWHYDTTKPEKFAWDDPNVVQSLYAINPSAISALLSSYEAMERRVADLEEALTPFADVGDMILAEAPTKSSYWEAFASCDGTTYQISLEYLRRARAALSQSQTVGTPAPQDHTTGWQPIATADKDGPRMMLGVIRDGNLEEVHIGAYAWAYNEDEVSCWWSEQADDEIVPQVWAPIPALDTACLVVKDNAAAPQNHVRREAIEIGAEISRNYHSASSVPLDLAAMIAEAIEADRLSSPQTNTKPMAWWWEDKSGCLHLTLDREDVHQMAREMFCEAQPLYAHPAPPENHMDAALEQATCLIKDAFEDAGREVGGTFARRLAAEIMLLVAPPQTRAVGTTPVDVRPVNYGNSGDNG